MPLFNNLVMDDGDLEIEEELVESGDEDDFLWPAPDKINEPAWMPFDMEMVGIVSNQKLKAELPRILPCNDCILCNSNCED